ncbi:3-oxoacyl-[acyl-carrier-protein] reductase [Fusobacterium naviforme]|nr:3-oxoacyl-[acyl-carrier-protein] reductase [Fusobacterium naviforme]PSL09156.1 3-oxoacyl-[acyl-carrier-protein] reductase [Fusobacterium naviforme]STO27660.1 3-oxoacyl-[acyl-carrier-protein] reductase FabG [Fusobacterium naviforme]
MSKLSGKTALVTGASRGIGRAIALRLAAEGAAVAINYNGSAEKAEAVAEEIRVAGGTASVFQADVADAASVAAMFERFFEEFQRLDILVNNAGITRDALLIGMKETQFDEVIAANLKGCFLCTQLAAKRMIRQRSGRIINISSYSGLHGNAGQMNYAASKAGVVGMTKTAARELGGRGITVNAIAPGMVETDMTAALSGKAREAILAQVPLQRMGRAEEIAAAAAFLAGDEAAYITGQVLSVDGGLSI